MDPVMGWYEGAAPSGSRFARFSAEEALRMCEALEVTSLSLIGPSASDAPIGAVTEAFQAVCDRAAAFGARVHVEFVPFTAIPSLATAWAIVSGAERANGGVLFDTWHFFRGDPDFALLERIPGDRIFAVQIDDAAAEISGSLREDTVRRLLPGDGCFDLRGAVRTLYRTGALRAVGPEVISAELEAMPAVDAARLAGSRVRELVLAATTGA
jgi:sugar phosphate isomerase/epimerase